MACCETLAIPQFPNPSRSNKPVLDNRRWVWKYQFQGHCFITDQVIFQHCYICFKPVFSSLSKITVTFSVQVWEILSLQLIRSCLWYAYKKVPIILRNNVGIYMDFKQSLLRYIETIQTIRFQHCSVRDGSGSLVNYTNWTIILSLFG